MTTGFEKQSSIVSFILTTLLFILFVVLCFTVKFEKKPVYKTIQIQLASTPVSEPKKNQSQAETAPLAEEAVPPVESVSEPAPAPAPKPAPAPVKSESAKPAPKKTESKPSQSKPAQTKSDSPKTTETPFWKMTKTPEDLAKEQASQKKTSTYDDSVFDNAETATSSSSSSVKTSQSQSGFSGSSGTAASSSTDTAVTSTNSGNRTTQQNASSQTSSKLAKVVSQDFSSNNSGKVKSTTTAKVSSSSGKTSLVMSDGKARELLQPAKPEIGISEKNASLVESDITVQISFQVLGNGRVPISGISFKPESLLPLAIRNEIKSQISTWLFSEDPSGAQATASFEYTIEVR